MLDSDGSGEYVTLTDRAGEYRSCRCPRVGGFVPDVYAVAVRDTQRRIIGEAKSEADFSTDHTYRQLIAFARHLSIFERPTLIVAVPFLVLPAAAALLNQLLSTYPTIASFTIAPSAQQRTSIGWHR